MVRNLFPREKRYDAPAELAPAEHEDALDSLVYEPKAYILSVKTLGGVLYNPRDKSLSHSDFIARRRV